jgi:SAM-dependent MidA family methyltransferase
MSPLEEIIRAEIARAGPMRFDKFMEFALYHPGLGYYAKRPKIGRTGDFYTSVSVGPLFGRLLARQFWQMWRLLDQPEPFWIVEQGAHDGQLARDILEWCQVETPEFGAAVRYAIVDGPPVPETVARSLVQLEREAPTGVFFSNELVDAFPVRAVALRKGEWHERFVTSARDGLAWTERPIDSLDLKLAVAERKIPEVDGYTTEISLRARDWMEKVARAMHTGYVVTIDYGFPSHHYYAPQRTTGTLTAYARHKRIENVLARAGEQDITTHVDFTWLARSGRRGGLAHLGFVDQQRFLTGIAHDELAGAPGPFTGIAENTGAWQTLTHPQHLGSKFFALVQARNAPAGLDGLRFARPDGLV